MAWKFPQSTTSETTIVTLSDDGDGVFVAEQVFIATVAVNNTIQPAISAYGINHEVIIAGTVAGSPMIIGNGTSLVANSTITVEETGQVRAYYNQAIEIHGTDNDIINHGLISSHGYYAVFYRTDNVVGESTLVNTGTIDAALWGVYHDINAIDTLVVTNTGTISGDSASYWSKDGTLAIDLVTNSGKMIGDVELGGADDLYDGRLGTIQGDVFGGDGIDKLYSGAGNNRLFGQNGDDTLMGGAGADYLSGGTGSDRAAYSSATKAVIVSLANPAINSGDAKGDSYNSIENLSGSNFNDALNGNSAKNAINGAAGNDTIKGYAGNDTLTGYSGADNFVFNTALNASTNVDTITDFNFSADTIQLDDAVFAALTAGVLASAAFRANTTGLAGDSSDRIIYETDTGELYYDANGNASGGGILFAKVGIGLGITNADFVVI
ncbi:calcium-binding protein [Mesorhizobium sp. IMUNJ 23232]|uniref:calcium-binding protein n=1 Tax=Mesorhizobium sp. IMUNJ 23232 TaxID=3376064 RepID=UPI003793EB31